MEEDIPVVQRRDDVALNQVVVEKERYGQNWDVVKVLEIRDFFLPYISIQAFYNLDAHLILCMAVETGDNTGLDHLFCLVPYVGKMRCIWKSFNPN